MKFSFFSGRNKSRGRSRRRNQLLTTPLGRSRRLGFESLEDRRLLAIGAAVQGGLNDYLRFDVNGDHRVTGADALTIINDLNRNGAHAVGTASASGPRTASDGAGGGSGGQSGNGALDTSGDGMITGLDALLIINQLNDGVQPRMMIRVATTDTSGNAIAQITQGENFQLRAFVTDLRVIDPAQAGVFQAFTDVLYDPALAGVAGSITHASDYNNGTSGSTASPGVLDEVGGIDGFTPLGPNERLLFIVPMQATGSGTADFTADPADITPAHDCLLFGESAGVPINEIAFVSTSLLIQAVSGPTLSINDVSLPEGNASTTPFTFTVTLSQASTSPVTVQYATAPNTAAAGVDFATKSGTLTFNSGDPLTQMVTIDVNGDTQFENNETFFVNLSNANGAPVTKSQGIATIENDDGVPSLSIDSPGGVSENNGVTPIVFTVSLSDVSGADTTVHFSTSNDTAASGQDYVARPDTLLTIPAGQLSVAISVNLLDDATDEASETFFVNLSSPSGATIANGAGAGTILDNDPAPTVSIADGSRIEPGSGTAAMLFNVSLSAASGQTVIVPFSTAPDTATADVDYDTISGSVTFNPGETTKTISVQVRSDMVTESDETFFVNLGAPTNATIGDGQAVGTIFDIIAGKQVQIRLETTDLSENPVSLVEGGTPFLIRGFVDDLRAVPTGVFAAYLDVIFDPALVSITGPITFGADYPNIHSGSASTAGLIDEVGATSTEVALGGGERLLFSVTALGIGGGTAVFTADPADMTGMHDILLYDLNQPVDLDDVIYSGTSLVITPPRLALIDSPMLVEGDSGSQDLAFTLTLSKTSTETVTVNFATEDGSAKSGADYQTTAGFVTFDPGETSKTILVPVQGDTLSEADETFFVRLTGATGAIIPFGGERGTGTIKDNDPLPVLTVDDAVAFEGASNAVFTVHLSAPSGRDVKVDFATAAQTATADVDYQTKTGTLVIPAGATTGTITVNVAHDQLVENPETFALNLSNVLAAALADGQAIGTINDLPLSGLSGTVWGDANDNGVIDGGERGFGGILITLRGMTVLGDSVHLELRTNSDGSYHFTNLAPGVYEIEETQPATLVDGQDIIGSMGGSHGANDVIIAITLAPGANGVNYNFGETGVVPGVIALGNYFSSSLDGD